MKQIKAQFIAAEALIITDGSSEGMVHKCLGYVPGNMLLGAMAARWLATHPQGADTTPEFADLFLNGTVCWGHATPACDGRPCLPVPPCLIHAKEYGGLPLYGSDSSEREPMVFNSLREPPQDAVPRNEDEEKWKHVREKHLKCKRLTAEFLDAQSCNVPSLQRQFAMHVSLDPAARRAAEHLLFGYEALMQGTRLCATITCPEALADKVVALLQGGTLHVGHARSAGYGALRLLGKPEILAGNKDIRVAAGEHVLYLESSYFPAQSWLAPLQGLQAELTAALGPVTIDPRGIYARTRRLESFHGLWRLPRGTRTGFAGGSVLRFACEKSGTLPPALGGWQQEGYGRVRIDPDFLQPLRIKPQNTFRDEAAKAPAPTATASPLLRIWRQRSLTRLAQEQGTDAVWTGNIWDGFFQDVSRASRPSQSQRGNIRQMLTSVLPGKWAGDFEEMLEKQPGRQWKNTAARDPFKPRQRSYLSDIMLALFDQREVDEQLQKVLPAVWKQPELPGGALTEEEEQNFRALRHQRLLLEILRRWEKQVRAKKEDS